MSNLWILAAVFLLYVVVSGIKRGREQRLERIRADWAYTTSRTRQFDAIAASHFSRVAGTPVAGSLDARTWTDLNLDDVFTVFDRTESTLGQHALYHRLRSAPVADHLGAFEALATRLSDDVAARERAQLALGRLQDPHGYDLWWLGRADAVERHAWYGVFPVLTVAAIVSIALAPLWPGVLIAVLATNIAVRYGTDRRIGAIARGFRQCAPVIATAEALGFLVGADIDPIVRPLRDDVRHLARLKLISRWINGDPFMLSVSPNQWAVVTSDIVGVIYEYLNILFLLDATGVFFGIRDLGAHRGSLLRVVAAAGDVDAAISVASYREGTTHWTRPQFQPAGSATELRDLRHPLVSDAVPNSMTVRPGRGALVTGSNMSGKSTFLRTVGVNAILAQTLNTCLALEYRAPVFRVRSCIGRADDLLAGKSYYIVEVEALLGLVTASETHAPHLFLLDELFRGTNAIERIAAGQAVLEELLGAAGVVRPHVVLAATHDGELVELLPHLYDAYHFGDAIGVDGLVFGHRLKTGPATTRTAIALLRLHGAPQRLLNRAVETAGMLDRQRGTTLSPR